MRRRSLGLGDPRILSRHVLPNCLSPIIVLASVAILAGVGSSHRMGESGPFAVASNRSLLKRSCSVIRNLATLVLRPGSSVARAHCSSQ